uniref:T9SS sorting signal type C domain-containing protein n=1 Tax=Flavobacterium sp. TaxID=239 RepID=UPI002FDA5911
TNPVFNSNQVIIYKNPSNDFVINTGNAIMSIVKVFDIRGRLIQEKKAINANHTIINVGDTNEVLLVQITSQDGVVVTKKVIR